MQPRTMTPNLARFQAPQLSRGDSSQLVELSVETNEMIAVKTTMHGRHWKNARLLPRDVNQVQKSSAWGGGQEIKIMEASQERRKQVLTAPDTHSLCFLLVISLQVLAGHLATRHGTASPSFPCVCSGMTLRSGQWHITGNGMCSSGLRISENGGILPFSCFLSDGWDVVMMTRAATAILYHEGESVVREQHRSKQEGA